ncbi:MAG TPA: hypothetical protein VK943_11865 [Arenibaculum sp.]|nr:hypothetical protein [Arenibaculum sp.]
MTLGLYDYDRRRRRRSWTRFFKMLLLLVAILGIGLFSYQMGVEQIKGRETSLREENAELEARNAELERLVDMLRETAGAAEIRADELETRLRRELPQGELARLTRMIAERLAAGIDADRLAFLIDRTSTPRDCEPPETKRFILPTPRYQGSNTTVGFADGAVTVSGEGVAAQNEEGQPEGWFDPQQPVVVHFTQADGTQATATGMLPLQQSLVIGTTEHRFTVDAGARSFVEVTTERCSFP